MIRYCLLVGLLLFCGLTQAEEHTIRGTHWGMTMDEVKAVEDWEYESQTEKLLFYTGELKPRIATELAYDFHNGLLVGITYRLDKNKSTYIFFRSILGKKYGEPYDERTEKERLTQVLDLKEYGQHEIANLADFVYSEWRIHGEKDNPQTKLIIHHHSILEVRILYANLEYLNQAEQLKKDQERDAKYSLENSDDL